MIKTAIIGLGKVAADIHLPACRLVDDIQLVAGCEPDAGRREMMRAQFNIPHVYADVTEMLGRERPQLVLVCTPPDCHKEHTLQALAQGAHVLCEKPFMPNVNDADEVIAAAEQHGRLLAVNNQYRYMNTYRQVKEQIDAGHYGRPFFLQCWQQMFHPPVSEETGWRSQLKQSTLFEFGTHPLDLICYFFDDLPEAVNAVIPRARPEYAADVLVQMTLYFPGEKIATITLNRVSHAPERYLEMRLDCEKASLRLSMGGVARFSAGMTRYQGQTQPSLRFSFVRGGEARAEIGGKSTIIAKEPQEARALATARFLRALLPEMSQSPPPLERARHARNILRIAFAGYESAQKREIIRL